MRATLKLVETLFLLFSYSLAQADETLLINGAGATFPYPLYSKWFHEYTQVDPTVRINYQSIGSGGGIRQLLDKTVDFGASDAPMEDQELKKSTVPILHIPTVLGAVVLAYNLPGVQEALQLTPDVTADIFLGKIKKWNDSRLMQPSKTLRLPELPIMVVQRSDGSGTTGVFTDYLSKVSADWKDKVGNGKSVKWPTGIGGKGNEGVAGIIKQTPGAIGYLELVYAEQNKLPIAAVQNAAKVFVQASPKSITEAANIGTLPSDFRVSITHSPNKEAYPISAFTYLLVYQNMPTLKGEKIVKFLNWAIDERGGQTYAESLLYAKLPTDLIKQVKDKINTITTRAEQKNSSAK